MSDDILRSLGVGSAAAAPSTGFGAQPQDALSTNLLSKFQQNPQYAQLNQSVAQSPPVGVRVDPELLQREGAFGKQNPADRQVTLALLPTLDASPQARYDQYNYNLAHELGHHLVSNTMPLYDKPEFKQNLPYNERPQEQIAQRLESGTKRDLPPKPPPRATDKQLAEWRKKQNLEGQIEMLMRYNPQGRY